MLLKSYFYAIKNNLFQILFEDETDYIETLNMLTKKIIF